MEEAGRKSSQSSLEEEEKSRTSSSGSSSSSGDRSDVSRSAAEGGYARFAPCGLPQALPEREAVGGHGGTTSGTVTGRLLAITDGAPDTFPQWVRMESAEGVPYWHSYFNGEVRFRDPAEADDSVAQKAHAKNPHHMSLQRAKNEHVPDEELIEQRRWARKYRGKEWRPVYKESEGGVKRFSHWENEKGRRLANDLPRWFGPLFMHD